MATEAEPQGRLYPSICRSEASNQVGSLRSQLRETSQTVSQLETSQDEAQMTIKQLEAKGEGLSRQSAELQEHLKNALRESEGLRGECQELKSSLLSVQRELSHSKKTTASLQEKLTKSEEMRCLAEADALSTRKSLSKVEQMHAVLLSEHVTLQGTLTASDKEKAFLELELKAAHQKVNQLEKEKEELSHVLGATEDRLNVIEKTLGVHEREIFSHRQRDSNLECEKLELSSSLSKLQEDVHVQGNVDTDKPSEDQCKSSELKSSNTSLQDQVSSLETELESVRDQCSSLSSRVSASDRQVATLTSQLKCSESIRQEVQSKYTQLLGVLEGALGLAPSETPDSQDTKPGLPQQTRSFSPNKPKDKSLDSLEHFSSLAESGFGTSIGSLSLSLQSEASGMAASPSKLYHLDTNSVREAILDMQRKLMTAERLKQEAIFSAQDMEKSVQKLEEEKASLKNRLQALRSSLSSLQASFDSVVKERADAEGIVKVQKGAIRDQERREEDLQQQVTRLQKQLESEKMARQGSDTQINKYAEAQVGFEIERNRLDARVKELELQKVVLEEEVARLQKEIAFLQSSRTASIADFEHLQQRLVTSQQLHNEMGEQTRLLQEKLGSLNRSLNISQETEKKLLVKIQRLETDLTDVKTKKCQQEQKASELVQTLESVQKHKRLLEERVQLLTRNQLENESERMKDEVKELKKTFSEGVATKAELSTHLQMVEMQLQEREGQAQQLKEQLLEVTWEKEALTAHLKSIDSSFEASRRDKKVTQDRCTALEKELHRLQGDLKKAREDNARLRNDVYEAQLQAERLDVLDSSQRKQKMDLDLSLASSPKQNVELMKSVREMQDTLAEKERTHQAM